MDNVRSQNGGQIASIYTPRSERIHQLKLLFCPPLSAVKNVLEPALRESFNEANVSIVPCPDLSKSPFHLAAPGLNGETTIMELGSTQYLGEYPIMPNMSKSWDLKKLIELFCTTPSSFVIGASRALRTFHSEVATNFTYRRTNGGEVTNNSYFNFMNDNGRAESDHVTNPERVRYYLYGNFFICEGNPGNVLKVCAKGRQTDTNFPTVIQEALQRRYGEDLIGLGGTFVIKEGKVKNMIRRPRFDPDKPVRNEFDREFVYETDAPLVAVGTILSHKICTTYHPALLWPNPERARLRKSEVTTEHFHTFAYEGVRAGGHFINDSMYYDIEYEGYFNLADRLIHVEPPSIQETSP